ncbi:cytochrome c552 [Rhodobacteraceae bacterium HTCC2150]|nr:cytochrome c552 [Rhodobacteraceae bacterium HTCC2150]
MMFDTMTLTKITAALCGALLIFLMGSWVAETVYHGGGGHGHHAEVVYPPEAEGTDDAIAEEETVDFAEILAAADVSKGEKVFKKCSACHKLGEGENGTGPALYGVVGRAASASDGFAYSGAFAEVGTWTPEALQAFLEAPKKYAPGTKMAFNGLKKIQDRANVIAYIDSLDD